MESKVTIKAALAFRNPFRGADITFWVVPMDMHLATIPICREDFDLTTVNSRHLWFINEIHAKLINEQVLFYERTHIGMSRLPDLFAKC